MCDILLDIGHIYVIISNCKCDGADKPRGLSLVSELFGDFYVTPTSAAVSRAWKLCGGSVREYQKLRRHALKLAHFPNCGDWDWIKTLPGKRVAELRIDEEIAGKSNIRVIFFKTNTKLKNEPLPRIWTLTVFAKKSQNLSTNEVKAFRSMRELIVLRQYDGNQTA